MTAVTVKNTDDTVYCMQSLSDSCEARYVQGKASSYSQSSVMTLASAADPGITCTRTREAYHLVRQQHCRGLAE